MDELTFGGDTLDVVYDDAGHVQGAVGGGRPQTPRSYRTSVANKFPPGYLAAVSTAFRRVLRAYPPRTLDSKLVYDIYDQWKKACAVGRRVDLDCLIELVPRQGRRHRPEASGDGRPARGQEVQQVAGVVQGGPADVVVEVGEHLAPAGRELGDPVGPLPQPGLAVPTAP